VRTAGAALALAAIFGASSASAQTIDFNFGSVVIVDNGTGDTNPTTGILAFNQTIGGYLVSGTIDTGVGPSQAALIGSPSANLRLTSFTAEALIGTPGPMAIQFFNTFVGTFTGVQGADSLDAYVGHSTGAAVPAGQDLILDWQGFVSGIVIPGVFPGPPPYFNPSLPALSPPLPYTLVGHGPTLLPGTFINPVLGGYLTFDLTGAGDQLITYSSAEVGFAVVPEVNSLALAGAAGAIVGFVQLRRRRNGSQKAL
jgi:hypothetical protein